MWILRISVTTEISVFYSENHIFWNIWIHLLAFDKLSFTCKIIWLFDDKNCTQKLMPDFFFTEFQRTCGFMSVTLKFNQFQNNNERNSTSSRARELVCNSKWSQILYEVAFEFWYTFNFWNICTNIWSLKVNIFWEGHKFDKISILVLTLLSTNVKTNWRFLLIFVALSE